MRFAPTSIAITLVQLGGWLLVGFLTWLLLLTHDVVAAPAHPLSPNAVTTEAPAEAAIADAFAPSANVPSFLRFGWPGDATSRTAAAARHRGRIHSAFWKAREANRRASLHRRTILGLLLPKRSLHERTEAERASFHTSRRTQYERRHPGPVGRRLRNTSLGSIFHRNLGR